MRRTTSSTSRFITYMKEQEENDGNDQIGSFGIVTDDDSTRVYDDVIPPSKVIALSNNHTMRNVRRRIQGGDDYCILETTIAAVMDKLNDDLLCEILIKLSAKTLGQLKVINKRWYSFISHPSFVAKHTSLQTTQYASSFLSKPPVGDSITLVSFDCPSPNLLSETTLTLGVPIDKYSSSSTIFASCRGLFIVRIEDFIYIYNPLTKKKKQIPSPYKMFYCYYGIIFGGSTSSSQYNYNNHYNLVCLVEAPKVYKFKIFIPEKGRWRDSRKSSMISNGTNGLKINSISQYILPICYRGIIHWITREGYLIAFNLDKEESRMIEIPRSVMLVEVDTTWWNSVWLGVLEDEVTLVVATPELEIITWVLHDYENNKWKIKRKDVIKPETIPIVHISPLFFDGQRFILKASTAFYERGRMQKWMEYDVLTGVSKPLCSVGLSSHKGPIQCYPIINTLIEV